MRVRMPNLRRVPPTALPSCSLFVPQAHRRTPLARSASSRRCSSPLASSHTARRSSSHLLSSSLSLLPGASAGRMLRPGPRPSDGALARRYGTKSMLCYIMVCSMIGGISVSVTTGLGAAIVTSVQGDNQVRVFPPVRSMGQPVMNPGSRTVQILVYVFPPRLHRHHPRCVAPSSCHSGPVHLTRARSQSPKYST